MNPHNRSRLLVGPKQVKRSKTLQRMMMMMMMMMMIVKSTWRGFNSDDRDIRVDNKIVSFSL
jgi:hypothetical protein